MKKGKYDDIFYETRAVVGTEDEECQKLCRFGYEDISIRSIRIPGIRLLYFMACMEPWKASRMDAVHALNMYGTGLGAFVWQDKDVYRFHYHLRTPAEHGPHVSNRMTSVELVGQVPKDGCMVSEYIPSGFGEKAFWERRMVRPAEMDPESAALYLLMTRLRSAVRGQGLLDRLNRTDREYLELRDMYWKWFHDGDKGKPEWRYLHELRTAYKG